MITETVLNLDAIVPYAVGLGIIILVGIGLFLLHNLGGLKIFSKHDNEFSKQFLDKFPLVNPDFYDKTAKMRDAENNQEIHELNKRLEVLETNYNYIAEQLNTIMGEIKKRG